jgi:hypothetical protein
MLSKLPILRDAKHGSCINRQEENEACNKLRTALSSGTKYYVLHSFRKIKFMLPAIRREKKK